MAGNENSGKRINQNMIPFIIHHYLMKEIGENEVRSANSIVDELRNTYGIVVERRSIYRYIAEINRVNLMIEEGCTVDDADEMLAEDDSYKLIACAHTGQNSGFYVQDKGYDPYDIILLAQCVKGAKFLSEGQSRHIIKTISNFVDVNLAKSISDDVFLSDRSRTQNKFVLSILNEINTAMDRKIDSVYKTPEKISFKYLKTDINNVHNTVERRKGAQYIVSPFKLLINDGNYYLLAFDDRYQDMRVYRIDRMKDVKRLIGVSRDGDEEFERIDLNSFAERAFNMFGGKRRRITLRFINKHLDTIVERFGTKAASYCKLDGNHFQVIADIEVSSQFFSWLSGFGVEAKILDPPYVSEQYTEYLKGIQRLYES